MGQNEIIEGKKDKCNEGNTIVIRYGVCLDCGFEDELSAYHEDVDYDEFWGREHKYPVCPKCGGGVETYSHP